MHIAEGVLSGPVLGAGYAATAVGLWAGLAKMKPPDVVKTAVFSSAFFVASLIHIPFGPASTHLVLNGIVGAVLGWQAFPAIFIALSIQAILFQFGGFTSLGVNTVNMALPAVLGYYLFRLFLTGNKGARFISGSFLTGFLGVFLGSLSMGVALYLSGRHFVSTIQLILAAHVPLAILEGLIAVFVLSFLRRAKPELFTRSNRESY